MNRNEEFTLLKQQLEKTPIALETSYTRAVSKYRSRKKVQRFFWIPTGCILSICALFVFLVNVFPSFAYACGKIPILKELKQAVAFLPSLQVAIENNYVQPMGLSQTRNGITATIESVIVDQKRVEIFYTLRSEIYENLSPIFLEIKGENGEKIDGYFLGIGEQFEENGVIRRITIDFTEGDVPDALQLEFGVYEREEKIYIGSDDEDRESSIEKSLEEFAFHLRFYPKFTNQGKKIDIQQSFEIDGQTFKIADVEIYPTHMRLNLVDVPESTAWLKELNFYFENEKGQRFEKISEGITGTGSIHSPMMTSQWLESAFFYESKELTLYITEARWLEKDKEQVKVDLTKKKVAFLPPGVEVQDFVKLGKKRWELQFWAEEIKENNFYQVWDWTYIDEAEKEHEVRRSGTGGSLDAKTRKYAEESGKFISIVYIDDCPSDIIYLKPMFSKVTKLKEPLRIPIK